MKHSYKASTVLGPAVAALFCLTLACSTVSSIKQKPIDEGVSQSYTAAFADVLQAAREAVVEAGLQIDETHEIDDSTFMIVAKTNISAFSWGEVVRVVVEKQKASDETVVRVITKRKLATNVTAKGDYSDAIFAAIETKLP